MILDPNNSSDGISREELEQFWGSSLSGLTETQRKIIIELYRLKRDQQSLRQDFLSNDKGDEVS